MTIRDSHPLTEGEDGWISDFHRAEIRLAQLRSESGGGLGDAPAPNGGLGKPPAANPDELNK